jgi:hypothetical protein
MNSIYESWMLIIAFAIFMGMLGAYHSHHSSYANPDKNNKEDQSAERDLKRKEKIS